MSKLPEQIPPTHNERIINRLINKINSTNYKNVPIMDLLIKDTDCLSIKEKQSLSKLLNLKIKILEKTEKLSRLCDLESKIKLVTYINTLNEEFELIGKEELYNFEKSDGTINRSKIIYLK
jgi:hypothetical protein